MTHDDMFEILYKAMQDNNETLVNLTTYKDLCAKLLNTAVALEREECAKIAERAIVEFVDVCAKSGARSIVYQIRARGCNNG